MENRIYDEKNGLWYEGQGDYLLRCLELPKQEKCPIGIWGQRHLWYLKEYHRITYTNLLASGKLNGYLADIDEQSQDMFFRRVKEMIERQGVTEQIKAADQMLWIKKMENIRNAAMEIVNNELIYA